MLTRGLTWDNVWDVYKEGVSTGESNFSRGPSDRVPGIDALFSLPGSPVTIVGLFEKAQHLREHYPIFERSNYNVFQVGNLTEQLLKRSSNFLQATWPQIKTILSGTIHSSEPGERADLQIMIESYCSGKSSSQHKAVLYMAKEQHHAIRTTAFKNMINSCDKETLEQVWDSIRQQQWNTSTDTINFVSTFFPPTQGFAIPILEAMTFIKKHPELIEDMQSEIRIYGAQNPGDEVFFAQACELLSPYPEALIDLYIAMEKPISLENLRNTNIHKNNSTEKTEIKPLLQAYQSMAANERDSPEAHAYFADIFRHVAVAMENHANGYSNDLMMAIVSQNPAGVISRMLALHACCIGLFPDNCREDEIKQLKMMFKHDPRTRTGHAFVIKKFIPDFKEWFSVVQSLGLSSAEMWEQGLLKIAGPSLNMSIAVDPNLFEAAAF